MPTLLRVCSFEAKVKKAYLLCPMEYWNEDGVSLEDAWLRFTEGAPQLSLMR